MSNNTLKKEPYKLFNLPWYIFALIGAVVLTATFMGVLPAGMAGCFALMICIGTVLNVVGDNTPGIKDFLGGGAIVIIFGCSALNYFKLIPEAVVTNINSFFKPTGAFLDLYIAALITGSILGMNRKLLIQAFKGYFPCIFGGIILSFTLCTVLGHFMGFGWANALLLIALPIMGGGMGAGATPLSKIFEAAGTMTAADALSVMTPAVAIGNAISIVMAGILVKVITNKELNGNGTLMKGGNVDPAELEISPEMQAKRDAIKIPYLGVGLLVSTTFFAWGYILAKVWSTLVPGVTIHAYAWMIITVSVVKVLNILPEEIEIACYQWFQFIMKNLTPTLLVGIGICYVDLNAVLASLNWTYFVLCLVTCIGAFFGAMFVGKFVGFYPVEAGITAGLCMSNMGGTGDVAVLSAAGRMELMPFAQISSRLGGAIILLLGSLMLSTMAGFLI